MMHRVLASNPLTEDVIFVDSSSNMDRYGNQVYIFMSSSKACGLPIGVCILQSNEEADVQEAFTLYKYLLGPDAFYGREIKGPKVFMTDNCAGERNALHKVFPESKLLPCLFHILQAAWRILWDSKYNVRWQITLNKII